MRPKLKLNHISTLHDARYCSAVGVELLGFSLSPSEEENMSPASIAEIMEWLSGPESVGEFLYESPDEIEELAGEASVQFVSLPMDYPSPTATEISLPLVFRSSELNEEVLQRISELAEQFPNAKFEFPASPDNEHLWSSLSSSILERSILLYAAPDPIYDVLRKEGIKPFAFSLGDFVEEPDGMLDYESCDNFLEAYQAFNA